MLALEEALMAVEEERLSGQIGMTPDELDQYLETIIEEVERVKSTTI